jgi:hypothetical protein
MVFTMRYWKNGKHWIRSIFVACITFMAVLFLGMAQAAEIAPFQVERSDEGVLLSAQVRFDIPNVIEDTLSKGIPLFFVMEGQVVRERWYWMDKKVCASERRIRLAFQPLMRRWRLSVATGSLDSTLGLTLSRNFSSLGEALTSLKRVARWNICDTNSLGELDSGSRYRVDFRFRLDVNELPRPFQIGAIGQADWDITAFTSQPLR